MSKVKYPCLFCHKTTGTASKSSAGSKGSLQCGICDLWAHYECTGLIQATLEAYEVLINSGDCEKPFKCSSCKAALNKFNSDLNAMKVRMNNLETKQQETIQKMESVEARQISTDSRLDNLESRVETIATNNSSSKDIWDELKERERRETNLIIHNVCESSSTDRKECEDRDLGGLQKLFNLIDVKLDVAEAQWRNQVGAGGAERPPGQQFWGNFWMRLMMVIFIRQSISNELSSNLISMLEKYDVYFISISLKLMIRSILILNFPPNVTTLFFC